MNSEERSIVRPRMMSLVLALLLVGVVFAAHATAAEPLPSWNDGPARKAILEFVTRTTTPGSPDFLEPAARVAVFDNDGTLWPETPLPFQAQFVVDELKRLEGDHPEWKENPAITAALAGDVTGVLRSGPGQGMMLLEATHAGMTVMSSMTVSAAGSIRPVIPSGSARIQTSPTSRCSRSSISFAITASPLISSPVAEPTSCACGRKRFTGFRRVR